MRAGGCTVQQTLTAEAAAAVRNAVALARRRGHAQATPLHVAATLLASDSGLLRRACLQSHGSTAQYPLQCRALELCFNVALNRLPAAAAAPHGQPSLSNALIAALKRAQAHQRRGCIEQQAVQPLLAVKVEMEQLVVSILDDPSVSRVMREAGFFSTRVKTNVVESSSSSSSAAASHPGTAIPAPWRSPPDLRPLPPPPATARDVEALVEALASRRRKNTVIIGEDMAYTDYVVRHLMTRIQSGDVPEPLKSLQFVRPHIFLSLPLYSTDETEQKVAELHRILQNCCCYHRGAILYVGDLRWTLTNCISSAYPSSYAYSGVEDVVVEVGRMLACYGDRIRLVGTATYETYMRCNMRQPSLESQWELQPFTVPAGGLSLSLHSSGPAQDARKEGAHVLPSWKNPTQLNSSTTSLNVESEKLNCCRECTANYDVEARLLFDHNNLLSSTTSQHSQATSDKLPSWLRPYLQDQPKELPSLNEMVGDLRKKWNKKCAQIHQERNQVTMQQKEIQLSCRWNMDGDTMFHDSQSQQQSPSESSIVRNFLWASKSPLDTQCSNWPVIECSSSENTILNKTRKFLMEDDASASRMEVETALALGRSSSSDSKKCRPNRSWWHPAPNSPVSVGNERSGRHEERWHGRLRKFEVETLRWFCNALEEKVKWQGKVTQPIATAVLRCRSGLDKRLGDDGLKGDVWLLFLGSDRVGKRKMAKALAEIVYGSHENLISIEKLKDLTYLGRLAEIIRQNPHSVILLEDIEETDIGIKKALSSAMETGKLFDSNLSLSDVIIVMTSSLGNKNLEEEDKLNGSMNKKTRMRLTLLSQDGKLCSSKFSSCRSRVRISNSEKIDDLTKLPVKCPFKRKADWAIEESNGNTSDKRIGVALDLNYTSKESEACGASCNYAEELRVLSCAQEYLSCNFVRFIDKTVVFGEFNLEEARGDLLDELHIVFLRATGGKGWLEIDKNVMDNFVSSASSSSSSSSSLPTDQIFSKWLNDVFMGGLVKFLTQHEIAEETVVRLVAEESLESGTYYQNSGLPTKILVSSP